MFDKGDKSLTLIVVMLKFDIFDNVNYISS